MGCVLIAMEDCSVMDMLAIMIVFAHLEHVLMELVQHVPT